MFVSKSHRLNNFLPKSFVDFWKLIISIACIALILWTFYPNTIFKIKWNRNTTVHIFFDTIINDTDCDYKLIVDNTIYELPAQSITKCAIPLKWTKSREAGWFFDRYAQYITTPRINGDDAFLKIQFNCYQGPCRKKRLPKKMLMRVDLLRNSSLLSYYLPIQTQIREIGFYKEQQYKLNLWLAGDALQYSRMNLESC